MRERVRRSSALHRNAVMGVAVCLAFALADCGTQVAPDAGPSAAAHPDVWQPQWELQRPDGVSFREPSSKPLDKVDLLMQSGISAWSAVSQCNLPALRGVILTRTELASVSTEVPPDEAAHEKTVNRWLERLEQEFCPPPAQRHRVLDEPQVEDVLFVPAGAKWKRPAAIGLVRVRVYPNGTRRWRERWWTAPLMFFDFNGNWRLLVPEEK